MTTGKASVRLHSFPDNCKPKETRSIGSVAHRASCNSTASPPPSLTRQPLPLWQRDCSVEASCHLPPLQ